MPKWEFQDYLGWGEQGDGKLFYGLYVQNGRIKGDMKKALRAIIERYELPVTLTPNQNIILRDVEPAWKEDVQRTLEASGMKVRGWPAGHVLHHRPPPCTGAVLSCFPPHWCQISTLRRAGCSCAVRAT